MISKILHGDCLEVMKQIPNDSIDMVLCDLPYGTTNCKWDSPIDLNKLWLMYDCLVKQDGAILLFAQCPFDKILGSTRINQLRYEWIWHKTEATGHLNSKKAPMKAHENILVFYKKPPLYNPQKTHGHIRKTATADRAKKMSECYGKQAGITYYDSTDRFPRDVITFSTDKQHSKLHPTQKPVALCEYLIRTYTFENDTVLDNCIGSGTTAIACINTKRNYIGIEKEKKYYEIAKERVKTHLATSRYMVPDFQSVTQMAGK